MFLMHATLAISTNDLSGILKRQLLEAQTGRSTDVVELRMVLNECFLEEQDVNNSCHSWKSMFGAYGVYSIECRYIG